VSIPPTPAVIIPATAGYPLASEIPKQRGRAIKKTNPPETKSHLCFLNQLKLLEFVELIIFSVETATIFRKINKKVGNSIKQRKLGDHGNLEKRRGRESWAHPLVAK
jgi:hypothetical protein